MSWNQPSTRISNPYNSRSNNSNSVKLRNNFNKKEPTFRKIDFSNLNKTNTINEMNRTARSLYITPTLKNTKQYNYNNNNITDNIINNEHPFYKTEYKEQQINSDEIDKIGIFKNLESSKKKLIQKNLKTDKFKNNEKILIQGNEGNKLYIIKQGKVDFFLNSKYVKSKFEGDNFGSDSLISDNSKNLETIVANGQVECYTLKKEIFKNILNKELRDYFLNQFYLNDYSIELKDLDNIILLGSGSYGFVHLVRSKLNKHLYAIKALDLMQIKEENILSRVEIEKSLLLRMDHPFIAKCVRYIKNDVYLFYIMEFVRGKELFDVMREINLFNKEQTQFYSASILEVINYLHKQKIIYRDLKPENIMIKEDGYIKFIDFGTVKEIRDKTNTFIGTYSYMAPEIFKGNGYSFQVDMWSLGIMMYEFFVGKLPFGDDFDDEEEPMKFYNVLMTENLEFPSYIYDEDFKDLIKKILVKDSSKRLNQYEKIKGHPFFKDFEWERLKVLDLPAPYTFKLKDKINMNNARPYLDYIKSLNKTPLYKKFQSTRQIKFQEWYDDF